MAKHSHVPKFGNWDKDNIPYTTYFENARKEKAGVRMNPNDPEENPEAFVSGRGVLEVGDDCQLVQGALHVDSARKYISVEKHGIEGRAGNSPQGVNTSDQRNSTRPKSIRSESGSDKSSSDHSHLQHGYRHLKSDRKKGLSQGSNSFSPSVQGHSRQRSGSLTSNETQHHRTASVPKFGAWDETDPKSGEGFTVIFSRVKEEKQIASSKFPTVPSQTSSNSDGQRNNAGSSSKSKICCCLFGR